MGSRKTMHFIQLEQKIDMTRIIAPAVTSCRSGSSNISSVVLDKLLFILSKLLFWKIRKLWQTDRHTDRQTGPTYWVSSPETKKESELVQLPFSLALVNFGRQMMIDGLIAHLKELKKLQHGSKISKWIFIYGFMMIVAQALSKQFLYNKCNRMRRGGTSPSKTSVSM